MAVRAYNAAETKADLYARITSDGEFELLLGDFVKGDVLPALWQYDASSAATDDFANGVIRPTLQTGNGRWIRQNTTVTKAYIDAILTTMQSDINSKFPNPTGNTTQYLRGDGTVAAFPVLATVATTGAYSDLSGQPIIPTNTNQLANGAGFISSVPAQSFASLTGKPTTVSGYGITDAYPLSGNPSGFLTSISGGQVTSALGFTPYNATNPNGYISGINSTQVTTALGYTPYNGATNPNGYITSASLPPALSINNSPSVTIQTVAASGNGTQISSTRSSNVNYSVTIATTISLSGNATGYVVLEICPTNSSTAGDWIEIGRVTSGQTGTLVVGLVLNQSGGGQIGGIVPAGYYRRLRSVNSSGTPSYTYNSGQEVLI